MIGLLTPHTMGWLLSLLSSIRLALKHLSEPNNLAYLALTSVTKKKCFLTLTPDLKLESGDSNPPSSYVSQDQVTILQKKTIPK
jgi:hypothetical protein